MLLWGTEGFINSDVRSLKHKEWNTDQLLLFWTLSVLGRTLLLFLKSGCCFAHTHVSSCLLQDLITYNHFSMHFYFCSPVYKCICVIIIFFFCPTFFCVTHFLVLLYFSLSLHEECITVLSPSNNKQIRSSSALKEKKKWKNLHE